MANLSDLVILLEHFQIEKDAGGGANAWRVEHVKLKRQMETPSIWNAIKFYLDGSISILIIGFGTKRMTSLLIKGIESRGISLIDFTDTKRAWGD